MKDGLEMVEMETGEIKSVCEKFAIKGEYLRYELINSGHINTTYRV